MGRKTPPFPAYPAWTTSKFWSFLRSGLRSKWNRWPPKYIVLNRARRLKPKNKVGRHKYEYKCNKCKRFYQGKEVSVDHIVPVGGLNKLEDIPQFVENLFCHEDNLQVLCKTCHDKKTQEDKL